MPNIVCLYGDITGAPEDLLELKKGCNDKNEITSFDISTLTNLPDLKICNSKDYWHATNIQPRNRMNLGFDFTSFNEVRMVGESAWNYPDAELNLLSGMFNLRLDCKYIEPASQFCGRALFNDGKLIEEKAYYFETYEAGVFHLFGLEGLFDFFVFSDDDESSITEALEQLDLSVNAWNSQYLEMQLACPSKAELEEFLLSRSS